MAKYKDKIDLYSDRGKLIESDVPIEAVSPLLNPTIRKIINTTKRTVAINLGGIEKSLASGKLGGKEKKIRSRAMKYDIVGNADNIAAKIKELVQIREDDDTNMEVLSNGNLLLLQVPSVRIEVGGEFVAGITSAAAATTQALIEFFNVDMFDAPYVKAAVWGSYPHTMTLDGANVSSMLNIPQNDEGLGYALRNIGVNHYVAITKKNAINAAALASLFEQTAMFEMGNAIGPFERFHLLGFAYQGLNANNLVYDLVKENGKDGTTGSVVQSVVARAVEDGVIKPDTKLPSGFVFYTTDDVPLWNAYAAAGLLASTMVNQGAMRAAQGVSSNLIYFNDLLERATGLPACDFGRVEGTGVSMSFFSHSIYGGGGPGIFNGNHIVTRHSAGFAIPIVAAAMALDAGTQMFSPESTSKVIGDIYGRIPEFVEPIKFVAEGAKEIKKDI
ncbi:MAG: coenzyme-B sulfoethylthiotransferase subunit beta [Candidatus Methanoliparum thermophilum]|uniref:Methyl-coenzyme M reductase subunit beta n=1 Tax=Methanoliparum thermophilum TaxID=2491083 RepID=A0A520KTQ9_METT2|nr:coenzyme-B sulfoethylthiotransferase subunit beta [Candidatus Methanoliparum sp. LAM-1]RZN65465.1 MAG: coenzyme-B sulfoethylthiotransferase subunit beta [Candidatus Methanoliparum thermophilum]BDC35444.1 methyl-coenzyme M reductase subunit beta [Candidatus Methanoliparum sp. LAM-1]